MFTAKEIALAVGGTLVGEDVRVSGVSTDTRTIEKGMLFAAVKGENFDGADFIPTAEKNGAAAVLCDRPTGSVSAGIPIIYTDDTRRAQLALARYYRKRFDVKLCGVTGSVGKTSTKDMIYAVLSAKYNTLKTEGNFNNDIGLPKTLFGLNDSFGAAVIEMGMSDLGEISALSQTALPDIAVITNIGWCHLENLGTRENILRAKLEILDGMPPAACVVINGDDELLRGADYGAHKVITTGFGENCDIRAENIESAPQGMRFTLVSGSERFAAAVPVEGEHHIRNALAAFAAARELGMTAQEIIPAFLRYEGSGLRQKYVSCGGRTFILDCYNASPDSMKSALSLIRGSKSRRVAVLGDMLELGQMSGELHAGVADLLNGQADAVFLYGREMRACYERLKALGGSIKAYYTQSMEELIKLLRENLQSGDVVLFKGSRGMRLEQAAQALIDEQENNNAEE